MAALQLHVSEEAQRDLISIAAYVTERDGRPRALKIVERVQKAMGNLALMPGMGRRRPDLAAGVRAFPVAPWIIVYEALPETMGISVHRVLDGRRDLPAIFDRS